MDLVEGGTMRAESQPGLTLILGRVRDGHEGARSGLLGRVYGELRRVAAIRSDPAGREPRLRAACGGAEELRAEGGRLPAQDERANRVGSLTPSEPTGPPAEGTTSWPARAAATTPGP